MKILVNTIEQMTTQNGKLYTKVRDSQGNFYGCWDIAVANQLKQGQTSDVITKTVIGKDGHEYTNIIGINTEKPSITQPGAFKREPFKRDPAESRLIVRQTALKAAIDYCVVYKGPDMPDTQLVLDTAELFYNWVLENKKPTPIKQQEDLPTVDRDEEIDISQVSF